MSTNVWLVVSASTVTSFLANISWGSIDVTWCPDTPVVGVPPDTMTRVFHDDIFSSTSYVVQEYVQYNLNDAEQWHEHR